jgi:hypothetical protein
VKENERKDRLARCRQIKLSVIRRKSDRTISIPVWFVLEGEKLPPAREGVGRALVRNTLKLSTAPSASRLSI